MNSFSSPNLSAFESPIVIITFALAVLSSGIQSSAGAPAPDSSSFAIAEMGPNHSVWIRTDSQQLPDGTIRQRKHSVTELCSGLNYWSQEQNAWLPSQDVIEI